jgi:hypothetical protein
MWERRSAAIIAAGKPLPQKISNCLEGELEEGDLDDVTDAAEEPDVEGHREDGVEPALRGIFG